MPPSLPARSTHKRNSIMASGQDLFLAHGYLGTSVDQVAAAAGVSKQTVYKHFGDKRELLLAIVTDVIDSTVKPFLGRIADLVRTSDLEADLTALARDYLRSVLAEPVVQLRRLVIGEANATPELARRYYDHAPSETLRAFADAFGQLHRRGLLNVDEPDVAAEHFAFLTVGKCIDRALFLGGPDTLAGVDVDSHVRAAVRVFLAGYQAPSR